MAVFNGVLYYYTVCASETVYIGGLSYPRTSVAQAADMIETLPSDFTEALAVLNDNIFTLYDERTDCNNMYKQDNLTSEEKLNIEYKLNEINQRLNTCYYCLRIFEYCSERTEFSDELTERYEEMKRIAIFDGYGIKNIEKTYADFKHIATVMPVPVSSAGFSAFLGFHATDVFASAFSVIMSAIFSIYIKTGTSGLYMRKIRFGLFVIPIFLLTTVFYITDIALSYDSFGIEKLFAPIISLEAFENCIYDISIGGFTVIWVVAKALFAVFLASVAFIIALKPKSAVSVCMAVITVLQIIFASVGLPSVFGLLNADSILGEYKNVNIFSEPILLQLIYFIVISVVLVVSFVMAMFVSSEHSKSAYEAAQKAYYNDITEKYNKARVMRHDIKNHFAVLYYLLDSGETEKAKDYLGNLVTENKATEISVRTGSLILDALIFNKTELAAARGCELRIEFDTDFSEKNITDFDLCTIFGNILDNAIEAAEKLSEEKRTIRLSVREKSSMIFIYCENGYDVINSHFETTKPDKQSHGNGLFAVRKASERYSGKCEITAENGVFLISVMLSL